MYVEDEGPISSDEAARRLGCSRDMVYKLLGQGKLEGHRVGRKVTVEPRSVEEYKGGRAIRKKTPVPPARPVLLRGIYG